MTRFRAIALVVTVLLAGVAGDAVGQAVKAAQPLAVRGAQGQQNTIAVDTSVTPNKTIFGCEKDQEGGGSQPVNGIAITGGTAGNPPTIAAQACSGGDTDISIALTPAGTGTVSAGGTITTGTLFVDAVNDCTADSTNMVKTRITTSDWALARTAAGAETYNFHCTVTLPFRTTSNKGVRIDALALSYQITTAALTSFTFQKLATTTYANNAANVVADYGGAVTITPATATQANPYLTSGTLAAPAFMNTAHTQVSVDFQVVMQNTGVFRFYGVSLTYSLALN